MKTLRGKRALITGAASGIGRSLAQQMAAAGAEVYLWDIDRGRLDETAESIKTDGCVVQSDICDLSQPRGISIGIERLLAVWGHLDILVNNAGIAFYGPTENMSAAQRDRVLAINLLAPLQITHALLPTLLTRPEAHLVNIASIYGLLGIGRSAAYQVSKFGLVGLSEAIHAEYGRQGLGVTAVCPGFVKTNLFQAAGSGHTGRDTPEPPGWLSTTPDVVAQQAILGILRNRRMVVVTLHARCLHWLKRFAPGLITWAQAIGRRRRMRKKMATLALEANG